MKAIKEDVEALQKELDTASEQLADKRNDIKRRMVGLIRDAETVGDLNVLLEVFRQTGETDHEILKNIHAQIPFMRYTEEMYITPEGLLVYDYAVQKFIIYTSVDRPVIEQDTEFIDDEG